MSKLERQAEMKGVTVSELLISLFNAHGSQKAVANQLGVSQSTISTWLLKCSLEKRTILVVRATVSILELRK